MIAMSCGHGIPELVKDFLQVLYSLTPVASIATIIMDCHAEEESATRCDIGRRKGGILFIRTWSALPAAGFF
jgi:hypothetical protein